MPATVLPEQARSLQGVVDAARDPRIALEGGAADADDMVRWVNAGTTIVFPLRARVVLDHPHDWAIRFVKAHWCVGDEHRVQTPRDEEIAQILSGRDRLRKRGQK